MKRLILSVLAFCASFSASAFEIKEKEIGGKTVRWFEEMVPMKDGIKLYTYGVAPKEGEKCPIIIVRNPYVKEERVPDMAKFAQSQSRYLERGYVRIFQHCRGCGMSEGDWVQYENERADGLTFLEWVRKLPFYNGEIFIEGGSYLASVHWSYLETNPPDLKGAYLTVQDVNRYNIVARNGFFKFGLHGNWFVGGYKKKNRKLKRDKSVKLSDRPLIEFSKRYWGVPVPEFDNKVLHPRPEDPFWKTTLPGAGGNFRRALLDSTMPVALVAGFYDIYTEGIFDMWREISDERKANCTLVVDAYDHGGRLDKSLKGTAGEFPNGLRSQNGINSLDWFDFCRTGKKTKNMKIKQTRYYALWENKWITEDSLENGKREVKFPLSDKKEPSSWKYDPLRPLPVFPGSGGICFGGMKAQPEPNFRDDVISFILPEITERIDARGRMELELNVESDCEDTSFYARISVRKKDSPLWLLLRDDIKSLEWDEPYTPGEKRIVKLRFADHAFRLDKGDVLRVDVTSGNSQFSPHSNIRGLQSTIKETKIANNKVYPSESILTIFAK